MSLLACVTVPDGATARTLAHLVVQRELAAGVNILPGALSVYRWKGEIREARECLLLAQVSRAAWEDFRAAVAAAHPYDVPCIVGMPLEKGHAPFLDWIAENSLPAGRQND
ncbi:divalent-cation tolerance protein CutA [uncultured Desulfovibrio sp.]|uniref:divalent-cation tolerance protein CutA n=1 Tax=uncultured Desulfovibrio sp. TaxID=167968 RepID=UPI002636FF45|nr:divalent-cation tolerance protein CutA [uncultured Desulfovibrio sp.]